MRSIRVWMQGLRLSFPARLLGSGAKGNAKQGGGSVVEAAQEPGGPVVEAPGLISGQD